MALHGCNKWLKMQQFCLINPAHHFYSRPGYVHVPAIGNLGHVWETRMHPYAVTGAPVVPGAVAPPGQFKKELMQAKRRESEMSARLSALEGEVQNARTVTQTQQAQAEDLSDRLTVRAGSFRLAAEICICVVAGCCPLPFCRLTFETATHASTPAFPP